MNKRIGNFQVNVHSDGSGMGISTELYGKAEIDFRAEDLSDLLHCVKEMTRYEMQRENIFKDTSSPHLQGIL